MVEVTYGLLFNSLRDMPDLCPKGADFGVKPSAPSCTFPRVGLPSEHTEDQDTLPGGAASVSVEIPIVPIVVETI